MMDEYIKREDLRQAYEESLRKDYHRIEGASAVHAQEHRHILRILDKMPAADVIEVRTLTELLRKLERKAREQELEPPLLTTRNYQFNAIRRFIEAFIREIQDGLLGNNTPENCNKSRYIELPCNVGDMVYMPWEWNGAKGIACLKVTTMTNILGFGWSVGTDFDTDDEGYADKYKCGSFEFPDFGKTVFLTKEEAEKALKESDSK